MPTPTPTPTPTSGPQQFMDDFLLRQPGERTTLKHGSHDQKDHGRRGGAGGDGESGDSKIDNGINKAQSILVEGRPRDAYVDGLRRGAGMDAAGARRAGAALRRHSREISDHMRARGYEDAIKLKKGVDVYKIIAEAAGYWGMLEDPTK